MNKILEDIWKHSEQTAMRERLSRIIEDREILSESYSEGIDCKKGTITVQFKVRIDG